ncbi:MAG: hypothetical protein Q8916_05150 [Bacteroidota bacterium]|nr:hypothetical protein [Bacteroidota bacterium]MDP4229775.1 hypothetical protein [Bacteroidota bacterium]MDP4237012.1 hypothetical protein [Bacteroidota bacterium]
MKNSFRLLALAAFTFLVGCSSSPTAPTTNNNSTESNATDSTSYFPLSTGSSWHYTGFADYTVSIVGDTTFNGHSWKIINNTASSGRGFVRKSGTTYINFSPSGQPVAGEFIGVNEAPGSTWAWDITNNGLATHYAFTNAKQGMTHIVLGKTYKNVIDVHLDYSSTFNGVVVQTSTGEYYYAQGIGLIDADLGSLGSSQLTSYTIK